MDVVGVPPVNDHDQEVGEQVEISVKFTVLPTQIFVTLAEKLAATGLIVRSIPLSPPTAGGSELITLIRYAVPKEVLAGMIALMVPEAVDAKDPMLTGEAKEPRASDNSTVKTLPPLKVPHAVKGTFTASPAQKGDPVMVSVRIRMEGAESVPWFTLSPSLLPTWRATGAGAAPRIIFPLPADIAITCMPLMVNLSFAPPPPPAKL